MNRLKLLAIAAAVVCAASAQAEDYNRLTLTYGNTQYAYTRTFDNVNANFCTNGVGISFMHGAQLAEDQPYYIEAGVEANLGFGGPKRVEEIESTVTAYTLTSKIDYTMLDFAVPVNFAYRFTASQRVTITPYAGINFRLNSLGNFKDKTTVSLTPEQQQTLEVYDTESDTRSVFSRTDVGGTALMWRHFQMGAQLGVGVEVDHLYLGVQYGIDFLPAYRRTVPQPDGSDITYQLNTGRLKVAIGYAF